MSPSKSSVNECEPLSNVPQEPRRNQPTTSRSLAGDPDNPSLSDIDTSGDSSLSSASSEDIRTMYEDPDTPNPHPPDPPEPSQGINLDSSDSSVGSTPSLKPRRPTTRSSSTRDPTSQASLTTHRRSNKKRRSDKKKATKSYKTMESIKDPDETKLSNILFKIQVDNAELADAFTGSEITQCIKEADYSLDETLARLIAREEERRVDYEEAVGLKPPPKSSKTPAKPATNSSLEVKTIQHVQPYNLRSTIKKTDPQDELQPSPELESKAKPNQNNSTLPTNNPSQRTLSPLKTSPKKKTESLDPNATTSPPIRTPKPSPNLSPPKRPTKQKKNMNAPPSNQDNHSLKQKPDTLKQTLPSSQQKKKKSPTKTPPKTDPFKTDPTLTNNEEMIKEIQEKVRQRRITNNKQQKSDELDSNLTPSKLPPMKKAPPEGLQAFQPSPRKPIRSTNKGEPTTTFTIKTFKLNEDTNTTSITMYNNKLNTPITNFGMLHDVGRIKDYYDTCPERLDSLVTNSGRFGLSLNAIKHWAMYPHQAVASIANGEKNSILILHTPRVFVSYIQGQETREITVLTGEGDTADLLRMEPSLKCFALINVRVPKPDFYALTQLKQGLDTHCPTQLMEDISIAPTVFLPMETITAIAKLPHKTPHTIFQTIRNKCREKRSQKLAESGRNVQVTRVRYIDVNMPIDTDLLPFIEQHYNLLTLLWLANNPKYLPVTNQFTETPNPFAHNWKHGMNAWMRLGIGSHGSTLQDPVSLQKIIINHPEQWDTPNLPMFPHDTSQNHYEETPKYHNPFTTTRRGDPAEIDKFHNTEYIPPKKGWFYDMEDETQPPNASHQESTKLSQQQKDHAKRSRVVIPQNDIEDMSIDSAEDNEVNSPKPKRRGTIAKACEEYWEDQKEKQSQLPKQQYKTRMKLDPKVIDLYSPLEESIQDDEHTSVTNHQIPTKTHDGSGPHWRYQRPPTPQDDMGQGIDQFPTSSNRRVPPNFPDLTRDDANYHHHRPINLRPRLDNQQSPSPSSHQKFSPIYDEDQTSLKLALIQSLTQQSKFNEKLLNQSERHHKELQDKEISDIALATLLNFFTKDGIHPNQEIAELFMKLLRVKNAVDGKKLLEAFLTSKGCKTSLPLNLVKAIMAGNVGTIDKFDPDGFILFQAYMYNFTRSSSDLMDQDELQECLRAYEQGRNVTSRQRDQLTKPMLLLPKHIAFLINQIKSFRTMLLGLGGDGTMILAFFDNWWHFCESHKERITELQYNGHKHICIQIGCQIIQQHCLYADQALLQVPDSNLLECEQIQNQILMGNHTIRIPTKIMSFTDNGANSSDNTRNNRSNDKILHIGQPNHLKLTSKEYRTLIAPKIKSGEIIMPKFDSYTEECGKYVFTGICSSGCPRTSAHVPVISGQDRDKKLLDIKNMAQRSDGLNRRNEHHFR